MNIVELRRYYSDGATMDEFLFLTDKPREMFCTLDYEITDYFRNWLKTSHPEIDLSEFKFTIFYYHSDALEKI